MDLLAEAVREAIRLLRTGDDDVYGITARTIAITGTSTLVAMLIGLPIGFALALTSFPGRRALVTLANAGTGAPPVIAGLVVSIMLWRSGPLGWMDGSGSGDFIVALRSALVHDDHADLYAGCGLVVGSDSKREWAEAELKLGPMLWATQAQ